jgi:hypothetical protein
LFRRCQKNGIVGALLEAWGQDLLQYVHVVVLVPTAFVDDAFEFDTVVPVQLLAHEMVDTILAYLMPLIGGTFFHFFCGIVTIAATTFDKFILELSGLFVVFLVIGEVDRACRPNITHKGRVGNTESLLGAILFEKDFDIWWHRWEDNMDFLHDLAGVVRGQEVIFGFLDTTENTVGIMIVELDVLQNDIDGGTGHR